MRVSDCCNYIIAANTSFQEVFNLKAQPNLSLVKLSLPLTT